MNVRETLEFLLIMTLIIAGVIAATVGVVWLSSHVKLACLFGNCALIVN